MVATRINKERFASGEKQVTDVTEKVTEKVTDIEAKILELISEDPAITTSKLADILSVTRKTKMGRIVGFYDLKNYRWNWRFVLEAIVS